MEDAANQSPVIGEHRKLLEYAGASLCAQIAFLLAFWIESIFYGLMCYLGIIQNLHCTARFQACLPQAGK